MRPFILLAALVALPIAATAQGTAPAQGVNRPIPRPAPETAPGATPAAPQPGTLTDGRPRTDPGGGTARTAPDTTARTPLPPPNQANPPHLN